MATWEEILGSYPGFPTSQIDALRTRLEIPDASEDELLVNLLVSAKFLIQNKEYPFAVELPESLNPKYYDLQTRVGVVLYNKMGAEGQTSHSEQGVVRAYSNADVPHALLREVTPKVGVV